MNDYSLVPFSGSNQNICAIPSWFPNLEVNGCICALATSIGAGAGSGSAYLNTGGGNLSIWSTSTNKYFMAFTLTRII